MKKILTLITVLLTLIPIHAQKISLDKVKEGCRYIETKRTPHTFMVLKTLTDGAISLSCTEKAGIKQYYLVIYYYFVEEIEEGGQLLLKMENDSIIELQSGSHSTTFMGTLGFPSTPTITFAQYPILEEQLQEIINNTVVKIRVETLTGSIDSKTYGKKFSKTIAKDYELIEETLKQERTIYDDF